MGDAQDDSAVETLRERVRAALEDQVAQARRLAGATT
jgi:hypothetical protein